MRWVGVLLVVCLVYGQALRVVDEEGLPVRGAVVTTEVSGKKFRLVTDSLGAVSLEAGLYEVGVVAEGFLAWRGRVEVPGTIRLLRPDYALSEAVITGSHAPTTTLRSLHPLRVLTQERLQAQGAIYLPQLLMTELNMRLQNDPNLGTFLQMQGLSGQNIKVLIDGVPVVGRVSGSIDLYQLPLAEVERVEIVEGPMSVLYGTDALGGVVNLITRESRCNWEVRSILHYESVGIYDARLTVSGGPLKHRLSLTGGRYFFQGWDPDPDRPRARLWRPREQYNIGLWYQWRPSDRWRFRIHIPYLWETFYNRKEPTITPYRVYAIDEYYHTRRWLPTISWTGRLHARWRWEEQAGYLGWNRIRNVVYKDLTTLEERLVNLPGQQDSTMETQAWVRGWVTYERPALSLQIGHEITYNVVTGGRIRGGRAEMGDYALWVSLEKSLGPRLTLRPAMRWAYNTQFRSPLLFSLHARYDLGAGWVWRGGYARGFRAPSLREMYLYLVFTNHNIHGNPDLQPETSHHLHTALTWTRITAKNTLWRATISAFYNDLSNLIQLVVVDPVTLFTTYYNLAHFHTAGVQPQVEWRSTRLQVQAGGNLTAYPRGQWAWEAGLNTTYKIQNYTMAAFFKYNGRLPVFVSQEDGRVELRWIGGFPWLDVSVGRSFSEGRLHILLGVRNAFGITQVQANLAGGVHTGGGLSSPVGMGRYAFLRLTYTLQRGQVL
jgi:outer membrane receptor for ferrienterochelin and colicins